jgi:hypothetical protein
MVPVPETGQAISKYGTYRLHWIQHIPPPDLQIMDLRSRAHEYRQTTIENE